jgi:imidazoleglycerol-phosphate dehydratase
MSLEHSQKDRPSQTGEELAPTQTVVIRETKETQVRVALARTGTELRVDTGLPFFDHMLGTLARYAGLGLDLHARGDLRHHLMEDVAITLGTALQRITPPTSARYADRFVPMDEALVHAALDLGGRAYFVGKLPGRLYTHFFHSLCDHARMTLHLRLIRGEDRHHLTEAAFKATGLCLREALVESGAVFSTKGSVKLEVT